MTKEKVIRKILDAAVNGNEIEAQEAIDECAKEQCIAFADWLDGEGYVCILHTDDNEKLWQKYDEGETFTTSQLYTLFINQTNKP